MPHLSERRPSSRSMHVRRQQHQSQSPHPRPRTSRQSPHRRDDGGRRHGDYQRLRCLDEVPRGSTGGASSDDAAEEADPDEGEKRDDEIVGSYGASEVGGKTEGGRDGRDEIGACQHRDLVVLKNVLRYAVSLVANRRGLLGSEAFSERQFCGVDPFIPLLDVVNDDGDVTSVDGYRLDQWLEEGVFRAIDAGHLRCLTLVVQSSYGDYVGDDFDGTCSNKKRQRASMSTRHHDVVGGTSVAGPRSGTKSSYGVTDGEERDHCLTERNQGIDGDGSGNEEVRSVLELFSFHMRDVRCETECDRNEEEDALMEVTPQRPLSEQIRRVMEEMMNYLSPGQPPDLTTPSGTIVEKNVRSRALSFVLEYVEGTPNGFKPNFFTGADESEPLDRFSSSVTTANTTGATSHSHRLLGGGGSQSQSQEDEELHLHQQSQQTSMRGQSQSTASTQPAHGSQATTRSFPTDQDGAHCRSGVVSMGEFATDTHRVAVSCRREVDPGDGVTNLIFGHVRQREPPRTARRRRVRGRCTVDGRSPSTVSLPSSSPRPTESRIPRETVGRGGDSKRKWRSPSPLSGGMRTATPARSPMFSGGGCGGKSTSRRRHSSTMSSAKEMGLSSLTTTPGRRVKGISPGEVSEVPTVLVPTLTPPRNSLVSPLCAYGSSSTRRSNKTSK